MKKKLQTNREIVNYTGENISKRKTTRFDQKEKKEKKPVKLIMWRQEIGGIV